MMKNMKQSIAGFATFFFVALAMVFAPQFAFATSTTSSENCHAESDLVVTAFEPEAGTATVKNTSDNCDYQVGLAAYKGFNNGDGSLGIDEQVLYDSEVKTLSGNSGEVTFEVDTPACAYQFDLFRGELIKDFNGNRYGTRKIGSSIDASGSALVNVSNLCVKDTPDPEPDPEPEPEEPYNPPSEGVCLATKTLGDTNVEAVTKGYEGGGHTERLWEVFGLEGFEDFDEKTELNDADHQSQVQIFSAKKDKTTVKVTLIKQPSAQYASHENTIGYYLEGASDTVTSLVSTDASDGDSLTFTVDGDFGFALKSVDGANAYQIYSENSLNKHGKDRVVIYPVDEDTYLIGFEDLQGSSDEDYEDATFRIDVSGCENIQPDNGDGDEDEEEDHNNDNDDNDDDSDGTGGTLEPVDMDDDDDDGEVLGEQTTNYDEVLEEAGALLANIANRIDDLKEDRENDEETPYPGMPHTGGGGILLETVIYAGVMVLLYGFYALLRRKTRVQR